MMHRTKVKEPPLTARHRVCYITALVGLIKGLGITPFFSQSQSPSPQSPLKSVLVLGGSSAVGAATLQLLRLSLPPDAIILAMTSSRHHRHLQESLSVSKAIDRASPSLVQDVKQATPDGRGVDAIIDTIGAGAKSGEVFGVVAEDRPRRYAQVWTGDNEVSVPEGVEAVMFHSRLSTLQDHEQVMSTLETVLKEGRYKPLLSGQGCERNRTQGSEGWTGSGGKRCQRVQDCCAHITQAIGPAHPQSEAQKQSEQVIHKVTQETDTRNNVFMFTPCPPLVSRGRHCKIESPLPRREVRMRCNPEANELEP